MARGKQSGGGPAAGHRDASTYSKRNCFRKDGSRVPVLLAGAAVDDTRQESVVFVIDLTERKRAEQERDRLRQLQADLAHVNRISMMGELTASLAHELKQPITAAITDAKTCFAVVGPRPARCGTGAQGDDKGREQRRACRRDHRPSSRLLQEGCSTAARGGST